MYFDEKYRVICFIKIACIMSSFTDFKKYGQGTSKIIPLYFKAVPGSVFIMYLMCKIVWNFGLSKNDYLGV